MTAPRSAPASAPASGLAPGPAAGALPERVDPARGALTLALVAMGAGWGLGQPLIKIAVADGAPALGLSFWQFVISAVLLSLFNRLRGRRLPLHRRALLTYLFIALVGSMVPHVAGFVAAVHLPSGILSLVTSAVPMVSFPIALMLGTDRFSMRRLAGLALGLSGVGAIVLPGSALPAEGLAIWVGVAMIAPLCYAVEGNVIARWGLAGIDPITALQGAMITGAAISLPLALALGAFHLPAIPPGRTEAALVGLGLINAVVYTSYVWMVGRAGAVFAGQVAYLVTGFGVIWAMVLLGERYGPQFWLALGLMLAGLTLVQPRRAGGRPVAVPTPGAPVAAPSAPPSGPLRERD